MLKGKDMLSIHDLSVDDVQEILTLAQELKALQKAGVEHHLLAGKTLGMIFEKSSTRTRVSFETGMYQLGDRRCFFRTVICSLAAVSRSRIQPACSAAIWTGSRSVLSVMTALRSWPAGRIYRSSMR